MDQLSAMGVVALLASVAAALAQMKAIAADKGFSPQRMSGAKRSMVSFQRMSSGVVCLALFLMTSAAKADDSIIPGPTRTIIVSSSSQLLSALNNAQPGDHILLTNGSYPGFTLSRSGQIGQPIVIRAGNTLAAKVSGSITLGGNDVYVVGVDVTGGSVVIKGARNRISSSRLRSRGSAVRLESSARSAIVDHNEIDSQATPTTRGWFGIKVAVNRRDVNHRIYRNYLHGAPRWTTGDDNSAILLGTGSFRLINAGVLVEYNLIMDWHGDAETISVKTSGHTIRFNTAIDVEQFVNRMGTGSTWSANWLENSKGIRIHDKNQALLGNRGPIRIYGGDPGTDTDTYYQPIDTLVSGNTGGLEIGKGFINGVADALPAKNTKVEAHTGLVSRLNEVNTIITSRTTRAVPKAFKLMPSDVGPFAPTAPRISD
jgi:Chondroitinase B